MHLKLEFTDEIFALTLLFEYATIKHEMRKVFVTLALIFSMCQTYVAFCPECAQSVHDAQNIGAHLPITDSPQLSSNNTFNFTTSLNCANVWTSNFISPSFVALEPNGNFGLLPSLVLHNSSLFLNDPPPRESLA